MLQNLHLLLYSDGVLLPYTDSFKYLGMVCDKQINLKTAADAALRSFTAGTCRVIEFVQKHNITTGYSHTYGFSRHTLYLLVYMRVKFGPLLTYNKAKRWTVPYRNDSVEKDVCWGSETPRLCGVSYASVDWNPLEPLDEPERATQPDYHTAT